MDDVQKQIASRALHGEEAVPAWVRAGQLFLIPAAIAAVAVSLYLFIGWLLSSEERPPDAWIKAIRQEGAYSRKHAAHQLAVAMQRSPEATAEPGLARRILDAYDQLSIDKVLEGDELVAVQYSLIQCAAMTRDASATERVVGILERPVHVQVKVACLDALGALKGAAAAEALAKFLDDGDSLLRKYAVLNLAATGESRWTGAIRAKLDDPAVDVTWNAAIGLAWFRKDASGADVLRRMLDRRHMDEQTGREDKFAVPAIVMACRAAAALNDASFVPLLEKLAADDRSLEVRQDARRALKELTKEPRGR